MQFHAVPSASCEDGVQVLDHVLCKDADDESVGCVDNVAQVPLAVACFCPWVQHCVSVPNLRLNRPGPLGEEVHVSGPNLIGFDWIGFYWIELG